jgi:hypothetical protein
VLVHWNLGISVVVRCLISPIENISQRGNTSVEDIRAFKHKKLSTGIIRFSNNKNNSDSSSRSRKKNRIREHNIASTSTFAAKDFDGPNYIAGENRRNCLVKQQKKIEVADDDLEIQMLDEAENRRRNKDNKYKKNPWLEENKLTKGKLVESQL